MNSYKLRLLKKPDSKNDFDAASLAVPMEIAKALPESLTFRPELTEDGILYRPVQGAIEASGELPAWITTGEEKPTAKPAAKAR